jgi:hypothetical protein
LALGILGIDVGYSVRLGLSLLGDPAAQLILCDKQQRFHSRTTEDLSRAHNIAAVTCLHVGEHVVCADLHLLRSGVT